VCCWAPQTAKTSLGFNAIGYAMDRVPGNFLCVFPDIKTSKETIQGDDATGDLWFVTGPGARASTLTAG